MHVSIDKSARSARGYTWLTVGVAMLAGGFMATQSRINGELSTRLGDPPLTAFISFGSGTIILLVFLALSRRTQRGIGSIVLAIRERRIAWFYTLAGFAGASFVFSQSLVVGFTGVALFSITFVCGLTVGSFLLDALGIGPAGRRPYSAPRAVGVGLAVVAVTVSTLGRFGQIQSVVLLILPLTFGVLVAWQQVANGTLAGVARTPLAPTVVNFMVGSGALAILAGIYSLTAGLPDTYPVDWWLYLGGLCGVFFVSMTAWSVRHLGALVTSLATTTGQILTAVLEDLLFPNATVDFFSLFAGAGLMMLALTVAAFGWKKRPLAGEEAPF